MTLKNNDIDVSIVVACYNDAPHLKENFRQICEVMNITKYKYEIIFVDDKSPDRCREVIDDIIKENPAVELCKIFHEKNTGRGRAVSDGLIIARGRMIGFLDIDLEIHARYLPAVLLDIERGADLVIARRLFDLNYHSFFRYVFSKGYIRFSSKVLGVTGTDSESGFKFFRRDTMMEVIKSVKDDHWFWDTEVVYRSRRSGKKITEVPALFMKLPHKKSTVSLFRDTLYYVGKLFALKKQWSKEHERNIVNGRK